MAEVETIYVLGEGGGIHAMDLPLPEGIADRLTKGYLRRINADGSPYVEPAESEEAVSAGPPAKSAPKADWVGYVVREHGVVPDVAEGMTKNDLVEKYGQPES